MEQNRATEIMAQGFVWAESVLLAVCQEFDIKVDEKIIPQIAFCFAGGMGNTGAACGAVAGAAMAIGLKLGRGVEMEEMMQRMGMVQEFLRRFEAGAGAISCRELTGLDLTKPEGIEELMKSDKPQKVCFPAVSLAYKLVVDLLKETSES